jgi:hypothetical protein
MSFRSDEPTLSLPNELFFPKPLTIFRESQLQMVMKNYRKAIMMTRRLMTTAGSPFDIRPAQMRSNRIVARMRAQYELPNVIIPCVKVIGRWPDNLVWDIAKYGLPFKSSVCSFNQGFD